MIHYATKLTMVVALAMPAASPMMAAQPAVYHGFAASYRPGLMQAVGRTRGMHAACMVAHTYHALGTWVTVHGQRLGRSLRCLVIDVPRPRDRARIIQRGIVVELAWEDNRYICGHANEPPRRCPVVTVSEATP